MNENTKSEGSSDKNSSPDEIESPSQDDSDSDETGIWAWTLNRFMRVL